MPAEKKLTPVTAADSQLPTVYESLNSVMGDVQAVGKTDHNRQQGYDFRGVDAVVNAVGPALREHGVIVVPVAEDMKSETYTSKGGALMRNVTVKIRWVFYGPAGDSVEAVTYGEAADAGDKAVPKAHSVAYRVALLQALCIPTHDPDPDSHAHERVAPPPPDTGPTDKQVMTFELFRQEIRASTEAGLSSLVPEIKTAAEDGDLTDGQNRHLAELWQQRKSELNAKPAAGSAPEGEPDASD